MKTITYLFWRFWKFQVKKYKGDYNGAYFFSSGFFAVFLIFIPLLILCKKFNYNFSLNIENKFLDYLMIIPIILICSLPIRLIFPKNKILSLEYSDEERKHYKYNFFRFLLIFSILLALRYFHFKGYFG